MEVRLGYKQTEVGVIPDEWDVSSFDGQFVITAAGDVNPRLSSFEQDAVHRFPIFSNALADKGLYGYCSYANHPADSITITARGTLGVAVYRSDDYTAIGRVLVLEPNQPSDGVFFAEFINERVQFAIESTGVPQLTAPQVARYLLAVPPVAEQRAIGGAVRDVDSLLDGLDRLITKKRNLKQAAMQQLLTGRSRLPGFQGDWERLAAREIGVFKGGSGFPLSAQGEPGGEYPFFKVSDMNSEGNETFMTTANHYISEETRKRLGATLFPAESIVLAKVGAAVFLERKKILGQASCIDNNMAAFVLDKRRVNVSYVHALLLNTKISTLVATTALPALNGRQLGEIPLALPPLPEQVAIAAVLSDAEAEISALEARRHKTRALKEGMMQELLTGRSRLV